MATDCNSTRKPCIVRGCSCWDPGRCLVRIGGEDLLAWNNADPAATLGCLLAALGRLLQPAAGDSAALYVGPTLLLLLQRMPSAVQPAIPQVNAKSSAVHSITD